MIYPFWPPRDVALVPMAEAHFGSLFGGRLHVDCIPCYGALPVVTTRMAL